jgi:hypothetical protein
LVFQKDQTIPLDGEAESPHWREMVSKRPKKWVVGYRVIGPPYEAFEKEIFERTEEGAGLARERWRVLKALGMQVYIREVRV